MSGLQLHDYSAMPDHVRRIIDRDGEIEFTPPSFERWLGRLQMLRTLGAMCGFAVVFLASYSAGQSWEGATVRGIIASIAFFFFAWAAGLFVFGELYTAEIKNARRDLELKERDRARRIEEYYRERLRAQAGEHGGHLEDALLPGMQGQPASAGPSQPQYGADAAQTEQMRRAA